MIATGDIVDVTTEQQSDPTAVARAEGEMSSLLAVMENVRCKVIYVPGNVRDHTRVVPRAACQPRTRGDRCHSPVTAGCFWL